MKLYAEVLSTLIETVIGKLVHFDQTGFLKGRVASDNVRSLLHTVLSKLQMLCQMIVLFSLLMLKAFDRQKWSYLWEVLERFGFGLYFISMAQTLYGHVMASVFTGTSHKLFSYIKELEVCPISPLLIGDERK